MLNKILAVGTTTLCFFFFPRKRTLRTVAELREAVLSLYDTWRNKFGVLLFLYSVILTKVKFLLLTFFLKIVLFSSIIILTLETPHSFFIE